MTKSDRKLIFISLTIFFIIFSSPLGAFAVDDENIIYIKHSLDYSMINLPDYSPIALLVGIGILDERLSSHSGNENGMMNTLTMGIKSKKKLFFELSGSHSSYSSNEYNLFDYSSAINTGWYSLDGSEFPAAFTGPNNDIVVNTESDTDYYEINMIAGKYFAVKEKYKIRTFIGYSYAKLNQSFETNAYNLQSTGDKVALNEDIESTYNGLILGTGLCYSHEKLKSYLSVTVFGYYIDAEYKGHQVQSNGGGLVSYDINHSDSKSAYRGRLAIESGISREIFAFWELGLDYSLSISDSPIIVASNKSPVADGSPTHIGFSKSTFWKIGLNLKYSF
jgi:hypothetical protein